MFKKILLTVALGATLGATYISHAQVYEVGGSSFYWQKTHSDSIGKTYNYGNRDYDQNTGGRYGGNSSSRTQDISYGYGSNTWGTQGASQGGFATSMQYGFASSNHSSGAYGGNGGYGSASVYDSFILEDINQSVNNYGYGSSRYHFEGFGIRYGFGRRYNKNSTNEIYSFTRSSYYYNGYGGDSSRGGSSGTSTNNSESNNSRWYNNCSFGYATSNGSSYDSFGGSSWGNDTGGGFATSWDPAPFGTSYSYASASNYMSCYGGGMGSYGYGSTSSYVDDRWSGSTYIGYNSGICNYYKSQYSITNNSFYQDLMSYFNCGLNKIDQSIADPYTCGRGFVGKVISSNMTGVVVNLSLYQSGTLVKTFVPNMDAQGNFSYDIDYNNTGGSNYVAEGIYTYIYSMSDIYGSASGTMSVDIRKPSNCVVPGGSYSSANTNIQDIVTASSKTSTTGSHGFADTTGSNLNLQNTNQASELISDSNNTALQIAEENIKQSEELWILDFINLQTLPDTGVSM